jgi:hypothetical protein
MAHLPSKADLRAIDSYLGDITTKLDKISKVNTSWSAEISSVNSQYNDITNQMDAIASAAKKSGGYTSAQINQLRDLNKEISRLPGKWNVVSRFVGKNMVAAFDKLGKSMLSVGLGTFDSGIHNLDLGLRKVWELSERWTRALGALNMRIGSLSPNMKGFTREAIRWEGQIRGLTDNFGQGLEMAQEFVEGFGRILPENELKKWGKLGLGISRGLGLGGDAAGAFLKSMYQLNETADETSDAFGEIFAGAKSANISVNQFSKEVVESRDHVISFGKEGQRVWLQSAAFVKKLGVSLKSLEAFTHATDTFDATTQSVAKLNTVFGTTIDSLDLMLKQDPGERFEIVRQQLLSQGKSFDQISRQERELIGETLHLTQEEVAGMLKSGQTLEEFRAQQEQAKAKQAKSEVLIRKEMAATAQTMFAFGAAWDRITRSITKLIRPFTDVLGLTRAGGKESKSFGQVMGAVFGRLEKFIDDVASNPEWKGFMKKLAKDATDLFHRISAFAQGKELQSWLKSAVTGAQDFYRSLKDIGATAVSVGEKLLPVLKFTLEHSQAILAAWLGIKGAIGVANVAGGMGSAFGALGKIGAGAATSAGAPAAATVAGGAGTAAVGGATAVTIGAVVTAAAVGLAAGYGLGVLLDAIGKHFGSKNFYEMITETGDERKERMRKEAKIEHLANQPAAHFRKLGEDDVDENGTPDWMRLKDPKAEALRLKKMEMERYRLEKGKEAEVEIEKHLKKRLKNESEYDRKLFQLRLQDYLRAKSVELGYAGDIDKDLEDAVSRTGEAVFDSAKSIRKLMSGLITHMTNEPHMAAGGIVTGPTHALIGESGPEAVVPLRSSAGSHVQSPVAAIRRLTQALGDGPTTRGPVRGGRPEAMKLIAGDVYLDGKMVGRHIVRQMLSQET